MSIYNVFIFIAALYGLFSYTTWVAVAILSEKPQPRHKLFIWVICICYMCSSSISYMLTAACCGCIGSSKSRYLLCRSSSVAKYINIVMYITMPISPRAVMT